MKKNEGHEHLGKWAGPSRPPQLPISKPLVGDRRLAHPELGKTTTGEVIFALFFTLINGGTQIRFRLSTSHPTTWFGFGGLRQAQIWVSEDSGAYYLNKTINVGAPKSLNFQGTGALDSTGIHSTVDVKMRFSLPGGGWSDFSPEIAATLS